jgi:hypothetical protein
LFQSHDFATSPMGQGRRQTARKDQAIDCIARSDRNVSMR